MGEYDNESGGKRRFSLTECREQERLLPIANVSRIMKKVLPANAKISKEAKETMQECVSEFISIITGEASDKCQKEKRKTINGDDLLWAITSLGFEGYAETLEAYLHKYRENTTIIGRQHCAHAATHLL
ncbi:nuclear transcription factor Y subunit B-3-like [Abrus precatorius]|uniref:Nuclear transcription factor Y subunit B-3-like n=1 Tax=Abrus precatorius TaxID=3816 RepID=A0A8B8ML58_ABRPR|nr:nuclear transcription factor Y subunit B-3-like [Abrus precatorius]